MNWEQLPADVRKWLGAFIHGSSRDPNFPIE
jgi:hypothetical protein